MFQKNKTERSDLVPFDDDAEFGEPKPSRKARAEAKNAAKADAKQAKVEARSAAKQAKVDEKNDAKQAKVDAKQAKVDEKNAAKQAKIDEKNDAKQAKIDAKQAKIDEKNDAKQAKVDAKDAAKQAKVDAKQAKIDAKNDAKQAKVDARDAAKQAKVDAKQTKADAKVAAAEAKQAAREEQMAAKAARKAAKSDPQLEADPEFGEPKSTRKLRAQARKAAKIEAKAAAEAQKLTKAQEKQAAAAAKKTATSAPKAPKSEKQPKVKAAKVKKRRGSKPREVVGLKVGASQIAAARVVNNGDRELVQVVREPLAPGIVTGGEVRDPAALGEALAGFFNRHKLPRKGVRLGLANSRIGVRVIEIAGIDDERQLANAIGFRAHETLSIPIDEALLDWHELSQEVDETGSVNRRILLVAVYRDSVDRYLAATDHAGIELAGIDLEAFALLRAVAAPAGENDLSADAAIVVVSVGHERTTLAISDGRVCEFTRVLEWGGSEVTAAIARALKVSPLEAAELKHGLSFEQQSEPVAVTEGSPASRPEQAVEAARFELQTLVREVLSSLRFYQAQPGSLAIGEILVSGGMAEMPGFAEELERQLGVRTHRADPLARVRLDASLEPLEKIGSLAVAIGLGIED